MHAHNKLIFDVLVPLYLEVKQVRFNTIKCLHVYQL